MKPKYRVLRLSARPRSRNTWVAYGPWFDKLGQAVAYYHRTADKRPEESFKLVRQTTLLNNSKEKKTYGRV